MHIPTLINALSLEEKKELFRLLAGDLLPRKKPENDLNFDEFTSVEDFCALKGKEMSTRLRNCLFDALKYWPEMYIETIDAVVDMPRWRNLGPKGVQEFIRLRGY